MTQCKYCLIKSTGIALSSGTLIVTFPNTIATIYNGDTLIFMVAQAIPTGVNSTNPVTFNVNGVDFQLMTSNANPVVATQMRQGRTYVARVGADAPNLVVSSCLPCSGLSYSSFPPATTTTVSTTTATPVTEIDSY